jgi:hypothetical protein
MITNETKRGWYNQQRGKKDEPKPNRKRGKEPIAPPSLKATYRVCPQATYRYVSSSPLSI